LTFKEFGLDESLLEGIDASGYENATPVQEQVIPLILNGQDIIASAQTGTGKTAAFLLPIINKLLHSRHDDHRQRTGHRTHPRAGGPDRPEHGRPFLFYQYQFDSRIWRR
jgi:superfamily II DNA/RNA helicase